MEWWIASDYSKRWRVKSKVTETNGLNKARDGQEPIYIYIGRREDIGQCLESCQLIGGGSSRSDSLQVGSSPPLIHKLQAGTNTNYSVQR